MSTTKTNLAAGRPSRGKREQTLASVADQRGTKRVNFILPADQHRKLKVYAAQHGRTVTELLTEYVAQLPDV